MLHYCIMASQKVLQKSGFIEKLNNTPFNQEKCDEVDEYFDNEIFEYFHAQTIS